MLVACLLTSLLFVTGQCQSILATAHQAGSYKFIECVISIIDKYFSEQKELTFVNMEPDDDTLLKAIHSNMNISLISRQPTKQMFNPNRGYLVLSADVDQYRKYFKYLIMEPTWNPYARFLIIIRLIQDVELRLIFDELLKQHVNNVVVLNATDDGHLYTYNSFENYACGRYYNTINSYGLCSETTKDLYPNKLVTGLRKCHLRASLAHRPPFSLNPLKTEDEKTLPGTEEYIINLLGKLEEFTVSFNYSYNGDLYSTVAPNMTAIGPMEMLQTNETDIIFGGLMMVTARAEAFTYLCGYLDYSDDLLFAVKRSSVIPTWKYIYLEFEPDVWALLLVTFILFTIIMVVLLRTNDGCDVALRLLDNLLLHGRDIRTRMLVKCVLITWVWFAYLINIFYQSNLFSFTVNPSLDFQVSNEEELMKYDFEPCFSHALQKYLSSETNKLSKTGYLRNEGCETTNQALETVSVAKDMFTLVPNYVYLYNDRKFHDKWGNSLIYYFHKPYTKFLFGYFFYKGFPITRNLQSNALRLREGGLADKSLNDHYYSRKLKQKFSQKTFETRFVFPWSVCVLGFVISIITFVMELLIKHTKWLTCKILRLK